jgi:hypothetical protein
MQSATGHTDFSTTQRYAFPWYNPRNFITFLQTVDGQTTIQCNFFSHYVENGSTSGSLSQGVPKREVGRLTVPVLAVSHTPALGTPALHSHNLIISDVTDVRHSAMSALPEPRLHQVHIAEAIAQGKP